MDKFNNSMPETDPKTGFVIGSEEYNNYYFPKIEKKDIYLDTALIDKKNIFLDKEPNNKDNIYLDKTPINFEETKNPPIIKRR